jgi:hypothetical protein
MDGTILSQGIITSQGANAGANTVVAGTPLIVQIPSNADFMWVRNYTQTGNIGTPTPNVGLNFYWQRGMPLGGGLVYYGANGVDTLSADTLATGGFTLYDPSGQSGAYAQANVGPAVATTATTNATRPVVSTANTAGIAVGTTVRLSNTAQTDVNGIDMVVSAVTANTSFTLLTANSALATAPGAIGGAGFYRIVNSTSQFYPRKRYVTNITQAANAQVSTSVAHGMTPGQAIRFLIPNVSGMTQLNSTSANYSQYSTILTVIDDYTFTIDTNTTNFTAFTWPTIAQAPCSFPEMTPLGENTAVSLVTNANQVPSIGGIQIPNTNTGILADSTVDTFYLGMILGAGGLGTKLGAAIIGPSGAVTNTAGVLSFDTLYWVAGKSSLGGL